LQCKKDLQEYLEQALVFKEAASMVSDCEAFVARLAQMNKNCSVCKVGDCIQVIGIKSAVQKVVREIRKQQEVNSCLPQNEDVSKTIPSK